MQQAIVSDPADDAVPIDTSVVKNDRAMMVARKPRATGTASDSVECCFGPDDILALKELRLKIDIVVSRYYHWLGSNLQSIG